MGIFKSDPPPAPDYKGAAEATAKSSLDVTNAQTKANRVNQITPWGSQTWAQGPDNQWTQTTTLSPEQQAAEAEQQRITSARSGLAGGMLGRVGEATNQPFDWNSLPEAGVKVDPGGDQGRQRIEAGLFNRMRPEYQHQQAGLETQLANMGLTRGSAAWNREMQRMGDQQSRGMYDAMQTGGQEQQRQFQMSQQGSEREDVRRARAVAEQQQKRGMPLNELNALLTGQQIAMPTMPGYNQAAASQGTNYTGAARDTYGADKDAFNAKQQQQQSMMSGAASMAMMFSDARLKSNIVRVGDHPIGVGIYEYDIFGHRERGVMAQELALVAPELVFRHQSGYLMVNYQGL